MRKFDGSVFLEALLVLVVLGVLLFVGRVVWAGLHRVGHTNSSAIEVAKDDVSCVEFENRTNFQPVVIDNTTYLQPITSVACTRYSPKVNTKQ